MPNGFLTPGMGGDALDGQVDFDEAFGVDHFKASDPIATAQVHSHCRFLGS